MKSKPFKMYSPEYNSDEEQPLELDLSYPFDASSPIDDESKEKRISDLEEQLNTLQIFCNAIEPMLRQKYNETESKKIILRKVLSKFCVEDSSGYISSGKFKNLVDCSTNGVIRHPKVMQLMKDIGITYVNRDGGYRFYPGYSYKSFVSSIPTKIEDMRAYFTKHRDLFLSSSANPPATTADKILNSSKFVPFPKFSNEDDNPYSPPPVIKLPNVSL